MVQNEVKVSTRMWQVGNTDAPPKSLYEKETEKMLGKRERKETVVV